MAAVERERLGHGRLSLLTASARSGCVAVAAGTVVLWLAFGRFPNYDAAWALRWGRELAAGGIPSYGAPAAPTPHPLATLVGLLLAPLGSAADTVVVVLGLASLCTLAWLVFRLGSEWAGPAVGLLAAVFLLTRPALVSAAARGYFDAAYAALVLGALLSSSSHRAPTRAGLGLLVVAGLLRPEAWLFVCAYAAWGVVRGWDRRFAALALAAPAVWALSDLAFTGDPLFSLHTTAAGALELGRAHGAAAVVTHVPGRLAAILTWPGLACAAAGCFFVRGRASLLAAITVALAATAVVTAAGMPVVTRYMTLPAALLAIAAAWLVTSLVTATWRWTVHPPSKTALGSLRRPAAPIGLSRGACR